MIFKQLSLLITSFAFLLSNLSVADTESEKELSWQLSQLPVKAEFRGSAATATHLWVVGDKNSVFVSNDAGQTWQDVSPNNSTSVEYNFRDIEVLNESTAIAMSVGSGVESTLQVTHDNGDSWQLLRINKEPEGFYNSIAFWDEQNGVLFGDPVDGHFVIEITKDQGRSWQRVAINKLPAITESEAAFAASGNTLITGKMGEIWFTTGGLSGSVYHSTDFGQSWTKATVPLDNTTKTSGGYALGLNTQQQTFVVGGNYLERDGHYNNMAIFFDAQWQVVATGGRGLRSALSCAKDTCVSTGKLSSDISFDAGKSWQPFSTQGFYTLSSHSNSILAAGSDGKVGVLTIDDD